MEGNGVRVAERYVFKEVGEAFRSLFMEWLVGVIPLGKQFNESKLFRLPHLDAWNFCGNFKYGLSVRSDFLQRRNGRVKVARQGSLKEQRLFRSRDGMQQASQELFHRQDDTTWSSSGTSKRV